MSRLLFCCRIMNRHISSPRSRRRTPSENNPDETPAQQSTGLASAVIRSLRAIRFGKGIKEVDGHGNNECAICLRRFHEGEWLRPLPNCAHVFHVRCIDPWFRSISTCPLCRRSVLYDFNDSNFSVSMVASSETPPREDSPWERAPGDRLPQLEIMRNADFRLGAWGGHPYETESDESFQGLVLPIERPSNPRRTVEELLKIAHNDNGESSRRGPWL